MTDFALPAPEIGAIEFRDWYRSEAVFTAERERLFLHSWSLVAEEGELANPGDYLATEVAGVPVIVIRDESGELIGLENICRHRGIPVLSGSGHCGTHLTCPYHQWSFRRDGSLAVIPQREQQFPDVDLSTLGLRRVSVGVWAGNVFVRPSLEGPTLLESLGEIEGRLAGFVTPEVSQVGMIEFEVACNWKLIVENHVDVYHLWYLHQRSLHHLDHRRFFWETLGENNWWSHEPLKDPTMAPTVMPFVDQSFREGIGAHLLFPNLMIVTTGSHLATYEATPITPNRTRISLRVRSTKAAEAEALVEEIQEFLSEDVFACEQMQIATGSANFSFGPLAVAHEEPVKRFHQALRAILTKS